MANGIDLGKAYVQIVPSADGISASISNALSGSMDSIEKNVNSLTAQAAGGILANNIAAPLTKGFEAVFSAASSFEKGLSEVQAKAGATSEEMEYLGSVAMKAASESKYSTKESTDALNYMAQAGWNVESMANSLDAVMKLAGATGMDLGSAADIVTKGMTALAYAADEATTAMGKDGLAYEMSNAAHFTDVLAVAAVNSNTDVMEIGNALEYVGNVAGSFEYNIEDVAIALGLMANAGVTASSAGTSLRTLLVNMSKPSAEMASAMQSLGVSLSDSNGEMYSLMDVMTQLRDGFGQGSISTEEFSEKLNALNEEYSAGGMELDEYETALSNLTVAAYGAEGAEKARLAAMLAGKTGMAGLLAIVNASDEDFQKLTESIYSSAGATNEMYTVMNDNAAGALTMLQSAIDALATSIGQSLLPMFTDLVKSLTSVVTWFNGLDPTVQKIVFTFVAFTLALGPVIGTIGNLITVISGISPIVTMITTAVSGGGSIISGVVSAISGGISSLFGIISANPVILVIAAITAAVVAFGIFLFNHWDEVKEVAATVTEWIGEKWSAAVDFIKDVWNGITDFFGDVWTNIQNVFQGVGEWFSSTFTSAREAIVSSWSTVKEFFSGIWQSIQSAFSGVSEWFSTRFNDARDAVKGAWETVSGVFTDSWEVIKGAFSDVGNWFSEKFTAARDAVKGAWETVSEVFTSSWETIQGAFEAVGDWFGEKFTEARDAVQGAWEGIQDVFSEAWESIQGVFDGVADWFGDVFTGAKDAAISVWNAVQSEFGQVWSNIQSAFSGVSEWFSETFAAAKEAAVRAWDAAVEAFQGVWQNIQNVFANIGEWFETKFVDARERVARTWEGLQEKFQAVRGKIENVFDGFADWAERTSKSAMEKFANAWNGIKAKFSDIWKNIKEAFSLKDAIAWGKDLVSNFASGIRNGIKTVVDAVRVVAKIIQSLIGFSEPDMGPLSNFHTFAPDMMKLFASGVLDNMSTVQNAVERAFEFETPVLDVPTINATAARLTATPAAGNWANDAQPAGNTYNFYSPKALDPVTAMREAKKQSQRMAMAC